MEANSPTEQCPRPKVGAACVQFDIKRGDIAHNLDVVVDLVRKATAQGATLLVLPEMWSTSFVESPDQELVERARDAELVLLELSRDTNSVIVASGLESDGGKFYNRALVMDCGNVVGAYRKVHLFSPIGEQRVHTAGSEPLVVDTSVGRIGVVICYDLRFPELVRHAFYRGVEILVVPAQWPESRSTHWRSLLRARAIENEFFVVGSNRCGLESSFKSEEPIHYSGNSRIVDPKGDILADGTGEQTPVVATLELRSVRTMSRMLPIRKDLRPEVYEAMWVKDREFLRQPIEDREPPSAQKGSTVGGAERRSAAQKRKSTVGPDR